MLLFLLAGIVIAIVRRKRHPKVSWLTVAGLVLFIVQSMTFGTIFYFLPQLYDRGFSDAAVNNFYILVEICHDIVFSAVVVLLVSAVLSQRQPKPALKQSTA